MSAERSRVNPLVQEAKKAVDEAVAYFDRKMPKRFRALDRQAAPEGSMGDPFPPENEEITLRIDVPDVLLRPRVA